MAIKRIFVPTDFSAYSERAVEFALEIARAFGASLLVFHCYPEVPGGKAPAGSAGLDPAIRANAEERLKQLVERFDSEGVKVDLEAYPGLHPVEVVRKMARETAPDLIVMGTHGRTGLGRALLGSVAEEIVREASCPVVTVKAP